MPYPATHGIIRTGGYTTLYVVRVGRVGVGGVGVGRVVGSRVGRVRCVGRIGIIVMPAHEIGFITGNSGGSCRGKCSEEGDEEEDGNGDSENGARHCH